tara:strand:+ start:220 stop:1812 length:1593 start_codon:yes stop_codon:yes gene_type:complete
MPTIEGQISDFTFKRNGSEWKDEISATIDINNPVILTGINGGGKTLTLRGIQLFSELISEPIESKKEKFEKLMEETGIKEISLTYRMPWAYYWDSDEEIGQFYDIEVGDIDTFLTGFQGEREYGDYANYRNPKHGADIGEADILVLNLNVYVETKYTRKNGSGAYKSPYQRRIGYDISDSGKFGHSQATLKIQEGWDTDEDGNEKEDWDELIGDFRFPRFFNKWKRIDDFIDSGTIIQFGPDELEKSILNNTGIKIEYNYQKFDDYQFWDAKKAYKFRMYPALLLSIGEGYNLGLDKIQVLSKMNKDFPEFHKSGTRGREKVIRNLNKGLSMAYDKARLKLNMNLQDPEPDRIELLQRGVYPNRYRYELDPAGKRKKADWLTKVDETPTFDMQADWDFEEKLEVKSLGDVIAKVMRRHPFLIRDYWGDFIFFFVWNNFIGVKNRRNISNMYLSSGQKRIGKMIDFMISTPKKATILVDEPELSLHIDWQRKLLETLLVFRKSIIVATHSPDIIYNHPEKVVDVPPRGDWR